ncbi:Small nuclear ribonucleoprotein family protein [Perilla frutescens var. hirtella]|uniref:Small nuclear ribonucleoprotein family protein n=1 Tax=Perilla frutescens var. hirtella TaxID=608512 RepID=A0AAD4IS51_PERFH|nr:Small nuclear ribonucleoprotein family protein [Perilla frutescens var. hirtella]
MSQEVDSYNSSRNRLDSAESATCDIPVSYSLSISDRWRELSIDDVNVLRLSKSARIKDDGLRLYHRFLAYNFFGRSDMMNTVTMKEIFISECMIWRKNLNFGFWLAQQWHYSANHFTGKVPLGSFVTLLAQKLHVALERLIHIVVTYFTLHDLRAMHLLYVQLSRPSVSGPSQSSSADSSSSTTSTLVEIQELFERHSHRIESRLDALDDRLAAMEQAVINFSLFVTATNAGAMDGEARETSKSSSAVGLARKLIHSRMLIGIKDGRFFVGTFYCIDKQENIILQDAVEYRSTRRSSPSPMEHRAVGLILIPSSCRTSCHVDCSIQDQLSLLSIQDKN